MKYPAPFTPERHREVLEMIEDQGRVTVAELTQRFSISPATARRDLDELEARGALRRTHGGAIANADREADPLFAAREAMNADQKARIGRTAAALVGHGEAVFIDAGTTAMSVARNLTAPGPSMIVTNSAPLYLSISMSLRDRLHVIGGAFRPANLSHVGPEAITALAGFCFSTAIIGCNAVDLRRGVVSTPNASEAAVQRAAITRASRVILVADSQKFGNEAAAVVAPLDAFTTIVTDTLDDETVEMLDTWNIQTLQC